MAPCVDADTGVWKWRLKTNYPILGGVTPTAGGLVFFGDVGGNFYAVDAANGQKLWGQKLSGVGQVLQALDDAGITDNTFVMYGTDNGPHMNSWPDGAMTPFRSEKNTNWEGAYRVPCLVRWPGKIKPGTVFEPDGRASRLAADIPRHGRRSRYQRQIDEGPQDRRHDL